MASGSGAPLTKARWRRVAALAVVDPEERPLAGLVSGLLFVIGGLTLASFLVLPGVTHDYPASLLAIAGGAFAWGAGSIVLIDWDRAPVWLIHVSTTFGFVVVGAAVAA